jgi:O-antigen ligase
MMKRELENRLSFILAWGALAVTLVLTDRITTDPVNVSKMVVLSVVGFSVLPILFIQKHELITKNRLILIVTSSFMLFASISIFTSENTFERGLYGAFSRNTGLVTYASLALVFLGATLIARAQSFQKVITAFTIAGLVNTIYSLLAASGNDIITWSNPYGAILGTFGNPNFISAFMGMFLTLLIVQIIDQNISKRLKLFFVGLLPFVALTVYFSRSLQGILVAAFGTILAAYFYMRAKEGYLMASYIYLAAMLTTGIFSLAGFLGKGPLASFLYSYTFDLRGEYWKAGINMGLENPLFGIGIDSYGTYYRTYRELSATVVPGLEVSTDTAHNVMIDIFAGTGFPGLIAYLVINGYVLFLALKYIKSLKTFDGTFYSIFLCWAAYQLQSLVSINQIGLAIWGWLLGGLLVAYSRLNLSDGSVDKQIELPRLSRKKKSKLQSDQLLDASTSLKIMGGAIVGLLIALPPFIIDAKVRNFFSNPKGTAETVIALGQSWPVDNLRLNKIIVSLANGNENENARELASFGALKFPNDYVSWWALDQLTRDGVPEKEFIRSKLHEIDPLNPAYFKK